ncbi:MAG: hypothetical protein LBE37_17310 [Sphingobacterium sp.]|uniref:Uncharacterized protein n=1 Tax=Sphingobacterium tabacisoli TaxID=2044855 RepID=A0ABW5KYM6_9SPHI|nr:hypothetical protein [Sphingobacterium tabacisoli]MDR2284976.1 hypothetical protein [Sphingobacterium sp.]
MLNTISRYRSLFAYLLAGWMSVIVISGIVFMHKEVTSKGEIITHIHPYDFTKKKDKHHHKNDAEIQFLNVVFQGAFIEPVFSIVEVPFFQEFNYTTYAVYSKTYHFTKDLDTYLRGPPMLA